MSFCNLSAEATDYIVLSVLFKPQFQPQGGPALHDEGLNVLTQKCNPLLVGYDTDGQTADLLDVLILWRPCDVAIGENQECCGKSFSATAKHFFNFDKNGFTRSSTVSANHKEVVGTLCMR